MAWRGISALLLGLLLAANLTGLAYAETRLALVVGNSAYQHTSRLANPANDARLMSQVLRQAGFSVRLVLDAKRDDMKREMLAFSRTLRQPETVGLFFYAGHGLQLNGLNYLVPVDADLASEDEVALQTVALSEFLQSLNALGGRDGRLNLVILDACRNNPFARGWRSVGRGLAQVDSPAGTLIAFATSPDEVAYDGRDGNSPYTKGLAQSILTPGLPVEQTFKAARKLVQSATAGERKPQVPWESTSLTGDFYFIPPGTQASALPAAGSQTPATAPLKPPREPRSSAAAATAPEADAMVGRPSGSCILVGAKLEKPVSVRAGTEICARGGSGRATINDITSYSVSYSVVGGRSGTCRRTEICSFDWDGAPLFNIEVFDAGGGARRAELLPNTR